MMSLLGKLSMGSRSLRPQLVVAFALMSVLPILLLLSFVFPSFLSPEAKPVVMVLVVLFALVGFFLMKKVIDSVITISQGVRSLASGEVSTEISCPRHDELGELSSSLNQLAEHIKSNMDELKIYGERTRNINTQINRQLVALSGLLEISNLITQEVDLEEVFAAAITKVALFTNGEFAFLMMKAPDAYEMSGQYGLKGHILTSLNLSSNAYLLDHLLQEPRTIRTRGEVTQGTDADLLKLLDATHLLTYPISVSGQPKGFVALGNRREGAPFGEEEMELIGVFAKQISLAVENKFLSYKIKEIEIRDSASGLYNKRYLIQRLDQEILRSISNQRPCAFIVLQVTNWQDLLEAVGPQNAAAWARKIAQTLKGEARSFDCIGRLAEDVYGIIVPEKNKRQAEQSGRQLLEKVNGALAQEGSTWRPAFRFTLAENPVDGADAAGLLQKIGELIKV